MQTLRSMPQGARTIRFVPHFGIPEPSDITTTDPMCVSADGGRFFALDRLITLLSVTLALRCDAESQLLISAEALYPALFSLCF